MSVITNLSPLLFLTFRSMYGLSYSQLGLLVAVNFCTQMCIDFTFSFFSHKFNIPKTLRVMPVLATVGLILFAVWPWLFPQAVFPGLLLGTLIFAASGGLGEVLISPVIAAIPAKDPDREMSKLHSVYAWGVVGVVGVVTVYFLLFGTSYWQGLPLLFAAIPFTSAVLFAGCDIPAMETPDRGSGTLKILKNKAVWLCVFCIFLGGATEVIMGQWSSGYLEQVLGIPKAWGDVVGVALCAMTLGLGRTLYSKVGKNIEKILFFSAVGAAACYITVAVTNNAVVGLLACIFTGFCVSMLWPGSLIVSADRVPEGGVLMYALMAAGGDTGGSAGPQLVGVVTDLIATGEKTALLAANWGLTPEQLGLKAGMLLASLFPLIAIPVYLHVWRTVKK
jgi:fucose permease